MTGFRVGLGGDRDLVARRAPGHERPLLGIQQGKRFLALAEFISDADMDFLHEALRGVALVPIDPDGELT